MSATGCTEDFDASTILVHFSITHEVEPRPGKQGRVRRRRKFRDCEAVAMD